MSIIRGFPSMLHHYDFQKNFREFYEKAVALYAKGQRDAPTFFYPDEHAYLAASGLTSQHLYDYAEDEKNYGEPGYDIALSIELVRRDYFLNVQDGRVAKAAIDERKLPGKAESIEGIEWLPRLIPKARAKLRGELPPSLMYCCGGDRKFFRAHDINPAEFLTLVWRHENDEPAIVEWVKNRSAVLRGA
jgi:hypothetical protein